MAGPEWRRRALTSQARVIETSVIEDPDQPARALRRETIPCTMHTLCRELISMMSVASGAVAAPS